LFGKFVLGLSSHWN